MQEKMIMITEGEYNELREKVEFLNCLEACDVDNWEGYGYAWEMMEEGEGI